MNRGYVVCSEDYSSVLLLSYSIFSGALGSHDLLLSYSIISLAYHISIILISTLKYCIIITTGTASAGLAGKFKLFFMGKPLAKWMYAATSTARDLADALMATTPSFGLGNSSASGTSGVVHGRRPVMAGTNTQAPVRRELET